MGISAFNKSSRLDLKINPQVFHFSGTEKVKLTSSES